MATAALPMMFAPVPASGRGAPMVEVTFNRPLVISMAGGIGVMAGLVGAGGAFLLVPLFIVALRIPVRTSIGTSLAVVAVASVAGFVGKAGTAQIPVWPVVFVLTGSVVEAQLWARLSRRSGTQSLRMVLAG